MKNRINTFFGLGNIRFSASIVSLIPLAIFSLLFYSPYHKIINFSIFGIFLVLALIDLYANREGARKDPKEIIIDEFLGMYSILLIAYEEKLLLNIGFFVLFRIIDIIKPFPFSWIDKKMKNWLGVLLDDIAIGVFIGLGYYLVKILFLQ
ncbi:MAG TPA: phosphatidylglycerophosphatase A [Bacteroidales bacterium]|nr:phosphatidylglycerophosphatase A [Bacteroidales bacterium]